NEFLRRMLEELNVSYHVSHADLQRIPTSGPIVVVSNHPFGGDGSVASNLQPVRRSIRWVKEGGLLATFPAGEVAHLRPRERQMTDPPWNPLVARIVRRPEAAE